MTLWVKLAIAAAIMSAASYAVYDYRAMAQELEQARANEELLKGSIKEVEKSYSAYVKSLEAQVKALRKAVASVAKEYDKTRKEATETLKVFETHDVAEIAKEKPALVERRVNAATSRLFSAVEKATKD